MTLLVFMVEEPSMARFLTDWVPRLFPDVRMRCVTHEGKNDLKKSIPRKLRAWREPDVSFVVLIDNDSGDCLLLKQNLMDICREAGRPDTLVRIVCQELESWWLGDPDGLAECYPHADGLRRRLNAAKYRTPDAMAKPSRELAALIPEFQKGVAAQRMAGRIDRNRSRSTSFRNFYDGLARLLTDAKTAPSVCAT